MKTAFVLLGRCLGCFLFACAVPGQVTQPLVAVHDSELTRALEALPATSPTPTGAGTTGHQWWLSNWHYFVMPESVKEALSSDGTAFTVVGDSNITAGLVLANGKPSFPLVISLAAEAIRDDEIGPLTNYVAAGGFLLVGSSAFTRYPDGRSRGDFAFANALGLHAATPGLLNWGTNASFTRESPHRLLAHIPSGQLTWRMPASAEEVCWGLSPEHPAMAPHAIWQVAVGDALVLASGDSYPYVAIKPFGKGWFIYCAALQPLVGHGGFAPTMYAYGIFRQAIEWAFESANLPVPKLSPWPYPYDAAFTLRHDLENLQESIVNLEASAQVEYTQGAKGDYYFCTGTLREEMADAYDTDAVVASLRRAVKDYQATIGPHNGGLKNPVNGNLSPSDYDYWHWGLDEALEVTPAGYASGRAYGLASLARAFQDVEEWTGTNGLRIWVSPYFNGTREDSCEIQSELGVLVAQDQKLTPFPHWTLSTRTPNKRYGFVSLPVSDWFVNGAVAQSLEPWYPPGVHDVQTLHEGIDFYYHLGGLINFYSHTLSTGQGAAGELVPEYIAYSLNTNLHPRIWSANAAGLYQWWLQRSQARVTASSMSSGNRLISTLSIAGATDPGTAVEWVLPPSGAFSGLEVFTNGIAGTYRLTGQVLKVQVGTTVTNAQVQYVVSGGSGFADDFTRPSDPGLLSPWNAQVGDWRVSGGILQGEPQTPQSYGYAYLARSWANYAVQARIQFPAGGFGGGLGGCLNPLTGAHYAAWIYPGNEGGAGGAGGEGGVLQLLKFQSWTTFGYTNTAYVPMQEVTLPSVGTNWHTLKLVMEGAQLRVDYDGAPVLSVTDEEDQAYSGGGVSVDMWADTPYPMLVDDVLVEPAIGDGPVLPVLPDQQVRELTPLVVTNTAADMDWPPRSLTYLLIAPPAGASIDSDGVISWTPGEQQGPTTNVFTTVVWDDGTPPLGATNSFTVLVQEVNQPPVLPAQADRRIAGLEPLVVTNTASDADLPVNGLSYRLLAGPAEARIDTNGVIAWTPAASQVPSTNLIVTVATDANLLAVNEPHLSVTNSFTVYVDAVHRGPELPRPANLTIPELTSLVVTNTARDSDVPSRSLSYQLLNPPAGASIDTNGVITWIPTELQGPGTNVLTTVVTDDGEPVLGDVNRFVVVVQEVNSAPTLPAQPDRTLRGLERMVVTNTASDADLPVNRLTYLLMQGPTGAAIDATGVISWTPTVAQVSSTNVFTTVVSDFNPQASSNQRLSTTNRFRVIVSAIRNGPVLPVLPEVTLSELTPLTVTNTAADADVPAFALAYTLLQPPAGVSMDTNGVITWTPTEAQGPSTNVLTTVVTDAGVPPLSATNCLRVIVAEQNGAPVLPVQPDRVLRGVQPLNLTNQAADADWPVNALTYQLLNPPAGATIDTNGVISWTPDVAQVPGTYVLTTVVIDDNPWAANARHLSATNRFTVVVNAIHEGPSLPAQATRTLDEMTPLVVTNTATDNDIPTTVLSYLLISPPAGAQIDAKGVITWTPAEDLGPSTNVLTTLVLDNAVPMISALNSLTVIVSEVNSPPRLPVQADRTLVGFQRLVVTNAATDLDLPANPLTYTLLGAPVGASIDAGGVISWMPTADQLPSTNVFTTVVTDSSPQAANAQHLSATNRFTVVARAVCNGPVLPDQPDRLVNELATLVVTNTATDNDMPYRTVSYTLMDPPNGATIDTNGVITWTPTEAQGPGTNRFVTVASDDGVPVLRVTNRFTVIVKEVNIAPVLPTPADLTLAGLQTLLVTNTAADADLPSNRLTYRLVTGPANASIDANGLITWTPTAAQGAGRYLFTTIVTDDNPEAINASSLSATNSFTVVVTLAHNGPRFPARPDYTISESMVLMVTNSAMDTDLPILHLSYTLINPPEGASVDADGVICWTPGEEQGPSTNTFTTVAMDDGVPVLSAVNHLVVVVQELNRPPVLPVQTTCTVAELTPLIVTNTATDADWPANRLTYSLLDAPAGATIDTNGVITWMPSEAQGPGSYTLTTVVTDSNPWAANAQHLSATNRFTVTVAEVNRPPELPFQRDRSLGGTQRLVVTNTARDPDLPANPLTYQLVRGPAQAGIDVNGVITWTPTLDQVPSTNVFTTVVTDNAAPALSATNSFAVVVHFAHNGPVLPLQPDYIAQELARLCITNAALDADVPVLSLSYRLLQAPAGMTIDANGILTWVPTERQGPGTNIIETVVSDNGEPCLSDTNRFVVVVQEVNSVPALPAQTNVTIPEFSTLVVTNTGTDTDIPANQLSYALLTPPPGVSIDTHGIITWTPTEAQGPGTNLITTVATDNGVPALSVTNSFSVVVTEVNSPPVLPLQPDRAISGIETLLVTNTASDSDLPANALTYTLTAGPANASIDVNGVITWTPASEQIPGSSRFEVVVTDNGVPVLSATNSFFVFVTEPAIRIQSVHLTNGVASIIWPAVKGRRYRLQYTDDLGDPDWKDVSTDLTALSSVVSTTNTVERARQRFYRLLVYPKP